MHKFKGNKCLQGSLRNAHLAFYLMKQQENESNAVFHEKFMNAVEAIESYGGEFGNDKASLGDDNACRALDDDDKTKTKKCHSFICMHER